MSIDPDRQTVIHLARRAIDSLPPAHPDTIPVADHQLDCYVMAASAALNAKLPPLLEAGRAS